MLLQQKEKFLVIVGIEGMIAGPSEVTIVCDKLFKS